MNSHCVTLWIGDALGPVERACLRSVARQGHRVALYCYRRPEGLPKEVEVRDASAIIPFSEISAPWCARADLYSDWFRYELLKRGLGTWIDADIYLVKPLDVDRSHLFGIEAPGILNNAVLRIPRESRLLDGLLEPFRNRTTPKWLGWRDYLRLRTREILTGKVDLTTTPWGSMSPTALTWLVREFGLEHLAEPQERFYPVHWRRADWIRDPQIALEEMISDGTVAVHLWNRCISDFKDERGPQGSFLHRLHEEGRP